MTNAKWAHSGFLFLQCQPCAVGTFHLGSGLICHWDGACKCPEYWNPTSSFSVEITIGVDAVTRNMVNIFYRESIWIRERPKLHLTFLLQMWKYFLESHNLNCRLHLVFSCDFCWFVCFPLSEETKDTQYSFFPFLLSFSFWPFFSSLNLHWRTGKFKMISLSQTQFTFLLAISGHTILLIGN